MGTMIITTGGMNQPPFADWGSTPWPDEQERREGHAHGKGENDAHQGKHRHQRDRRVRGQDRRANGCDPHGEHEDPGRERGMQCAHHRVRQVRPGGVGMAQPASDVRDPEPHRQQRRQHDHQDPEQPQRVVQAAIRPGSW